MITKLCNSVHIVARKRDMISFGDVADSIHLILSGWAARYTILTDGPRQITAVLLPGDFCDLHVTTLQTMDHSVTALNECKVAHIDSARLGEATRSIPILTRFMAFNVGL